MKCKRLFSIFCTIALSVMSLGQSITPAAPVFPAAVTAYAEETASKVTLNGMTFSIFSDHAEVTECVRSYEGELIIPDEVNGVPVTSIGFSSIAGCEKITSVTIPDTVTSINVYAFQACSSLASVTIPDSVTFIGDNAFDGTKWLEAKQEEDSFVVVNGILIDGKTCSGDIVIPGSVTMIGDGAFSGCHEITSAVIPNSVTKIGTDAFSNCAYLSSVSIPDSVTEIPAWAFYGTGLTSVVIPDSVTSIDDRAFCLCYQLETITIPESVAYIGFETFDSTYWMSSQQTADPLVIVNGILINGKTYEGDLVIPDSVTMIADGAFNECETITSLKIPGSVTRIGSHAFQDCTMLETVVMADSVTDMGEYAFNWCSNLESVTLSASLKSIEKDTFTFCDILHEIDIPASVSSIGEDAFNGCRMLETITINNPDCNIFDQSDTICTEKDKDLNRYIFDGVIWGYGGSTAQAYAEKYAYRFKDIEEDRDPIQITEGGLKFNVYPHHAEVCGYSSDALEHITIPSTVNGVPVTGIEEYGLAFCTASSVTLPASVTKIEPYALFACNMLDSVTILNPDCKIGDIQETISNALDDATGREYFTGTIKGYEGSTAQAYALKYGYTFEAISSITGDVSGDGEFNISDVVLVQKWLLGVPDTQFTDWKAADYCPDNKLNVFDLCLMKQALVDGQK